MNIIVRKYEHKDIEAMGQIWDQVVKEGNAFPQTDCLNERAEEFFDSQTYCGVAVCEETGKIYGMYILHPNNIGRCGHICNASYAVSRDERNMHIGEKLVRDCIKTAACCGYRVLQFNAVVRTNVIARHLYEKLGFTQLGTIKGGFRMDDGTYEDICPYYISLNT